MHNTTIQVMTSFGNANRAKAIYDSIVAILHNAQTHKFTFLDEKKHQQFQPTADYIVQIIQAGSPTILTIRDNNNVIFKIDIGLTQNWDSISLYPLEPYRKKKGIDCPHEELDLAFYIECMLKLCEDFVIWEFIAE